MSERIPEDGRRLPDGTGRGERGHPALEPDWFLPVERGFEQLLAQASEQAALVRVRDADGRDRGDWSTLLRGNGAAVIARILHTAARVRNAGADTDAGSVRALTAPMLADEIESWGALLESEADGSDHGLRDALRDALGWLRADGVLAAARGEAPGGGTATAGESRNDGEPSSGPLTSLINAVRWLAPKASAQLRDVLESGRHDPAAGLLLGFLMLLDRTRSEINRFPDAHRRFYYRDVLGARPRPGGADRADLELVPVAGSQPFPVLRGTRFTAGTTAAGDAVDYETASDVLVRTGRVARVAAVFHERDESLSPMCEVAAVTRIVRCSVPLEAGVLPGAGLPLFGTPRRAGQVFERSDARPGFACASRLLFLGAGRRRIHLRLELAWSAGADEALDDLQDAVRTLGAAARAASGEVDGATLADWCRRLCRGRPQAWRECVRAPDEDVVERVLGLSAAARASASAYASVPEPTAARESPAGRLGTAQPLLGVIEETAALLEVLLDGRAASWRETVLGRVVHGLLEFVEADGGATPDWGWLFALLLSEAPDPERRLLLHRVLALAVIGGGDWFARFLADVDDGRRDESPPSDTEEEPRWWVTLRTLVGTYGACDPLADGTTHAERVVWYDDACALFLARLRREAFTFSLSSAEGWYEVPSVSVRVGAGGRFDVDLALPPEAPAIVGRDPELHGAAWPTRLPVLRLLLDPGAFFHGWTLFEQAAFRRVRLRVEVDGAGGLVAGNSVGAVDPKAPFTPFGPQPSAGSWFALGTHEAAIKPLSKVTLTFRWAPVPAGARGLAEHYRDWPEPLRNGDVSVRPRGLRGDRWIAAGEQRPLFRSEALDPEALSPESVVEIDPVDFAPLSPASDPAAFRPGAGPRSGLFRIDLTSPATGFGHARWPVLFAEAMTAAARQRWWRSVAIAVPAAPWSPECEHVAFGYEARAELDRQGVPPPEGEAWAERLLHVHAFGVETVLTPGAVRSRRLLPRASTDARVWIGIETAGLAERVDLAIDLAEDSSAALLDDTAEVRWAALREDGWWPIDPSDVIEDSTRGLLTSGVVGLRLPAGMVDRSTVLPDGLFWLQLSTSRHAHAFPTLRAVRLNGVSAVQFGSEPPVDPRTATWQIAARVPGLAAARRIHAPRAIEPPESEADFVRRMSERLRHRDRAVSVWDYERIVLEEWPQIRKVKCLAVRSVDDRREAGHVQLVLVPETRGRETAPHDAPAVDVATLAGVRDRIRAVAPPGAVIDVRSASFERIQVRCQVRVSARAGAEGHYLDRLDAAISRFLSPWTENGPGPVFGWSVRADDVLSFIKEIDYIEHVTDFSMLRIAHDRDGGYSMSDTVRDGDADLRWRDAWSIAIPMPRHYLAARPDFENVRPLPTGIGELEIGATFVVPRAARGAGGGA